MNDNSIMPFGKYKGTALVNVPAKYLIWLHKEIVRYDTPGGFDSDNGFVFSEELPYLKKKRREYHKKKEGKQ